MNKTKPVTLEEIKKILREWSEEEHDNVCTGPWGQGLLCRHQRAAMSLGQVENAEGAAIGDREA